MRGPLNFFEFSHLYMFLAIVCRRGGAYVYIYIPIETYIHTYLHICIHAHIPAYIHTHTHTRRKLVAYSRQDDQYYYTVVSTEDNICMITCRRIFRLSFFVYAGMYVFRLAIHIQTHVHCLSAWRVSFDKARLQTVDFGTCKRLQHNDDEDRNL